MKLHLDFETRSAVDLTKVGAWAYALHPSTEILCMGYSINNEPVRVLTGAETKTPLPHGPWSPRWENVQITAHNAAFEYAIWHCVLHRRYGWPARVDPKLWSCTMARAAMVGLPLDLDSLGRVLRIKTPKDLDGRRVMHQLCKPLNTGQGFDPNGAPTYDNDPAKLAKLYAYNRTDVMAEMEVDALLPELPENERKIWELDLVMNRRGVQIDTQLAAKAAGLSGQIVTDLNARLYQMTLGAVSKASRINEIKQYLIASGVAVPTKYDAVNQEDKETLDKAAVLGLLGDPNLPQKVRDVITVRQQVGKSTSTAKYAKALEMVCRDGRIRGSLQYHGSHTGRWAGRLLQPQNFPKGLDKDAQEEAIRFIVDGTAENFINNYGVKAMDTLSDSLRGLIVAGPGKSLVSADFTSIELCVLMWLADALAVLAQLRRGEKPYVEMAQFIHKDPAIGKKSHPKEYDLGKRTVLGGGYGMGADKFKLTCKVQANLDISDELAITAIRAYREKYPEVVSMWYAVEAAAINAVKTPGTNHVACGGKVLLGMSRDRRFLVCRLPSGRFLWYWKPEVKGAWMTFCKDKECAHRTDPRGAEACPKRQWKEQLFYWGKAAVSGEWCLNKTYGGALVENITQAVARDLMAHGMMNVEASGAQMLLTVHDELLAEVEPDDCAADWEDYYLKDFMKRMCDVPAWAKGCPVSAEGWVGQRYRK